MIELCFLMITHSVCKGKIFEGQQDGQVGKALAPQCEEHSPSPSPDINAKDTGMCL